MTSSSRRLDRPYGVVPRGSEVSTRTRPSSSSATALIELT